jgi:hypothetical protein
LLPQPHRWDLRSDRWQPLIVRHPWATHMLPDDVLPLAGAQGKRRRRVFACRGDAPCEGRRIVQRQREGVAKGNAAPGANDLLKTFEQSLASFEADLDRLLEERDHRDE